MCATCASSISGKQRIFILLIIFSVSFLLCSKFPRPLSLLAEKQGYYVKSCDCWKHLSKSASLNAENMSSSCSDEATFYGANQNVISYSLFNYTENGTQMYDRGIEPNLKAIREIYPGWVMQLYSDYPVKKGNKYCNLICSSDDFFWCDPKEIPILGDISSCFGTIWRFMTIGDPLVDTLLIRDLDSRPNKREQRAVSEWLKSNKTFHFMRDHPHHKVNVLAGMWGVKVNKLEQNEGRSLQEQFLQRGNVSYKKGYDQILLTQVLYVPKYFKKTLAHDSYYCKKYFQTECLPFPDGRLNVGDKNFVGGVVKI